MHFCLSKDQAVSELQETASSSKAELVECREARKRLQRELLRHGHARRLLEMRARYGTIGVALLGGLGLGLGLLVYVSCMQVIRGGIPRSSLVPFPCVLVLLRCAFFFFFFNK